jgi:type III secretion system chaperone SycN
MSIADVAIEEFGGTLGIPGLAFNDAGVVRLSFESTGTFAIERAARSVLLLLMRPLRRDEQKTVEQALDLCHFRHGERLRPNAGLTADNELVFWVRLPENQLDVAAIEEVLTLLGQFHDQVA